VLNFRNITNTRDYPAGVETPTQSIVKCHPYLAKT